MAEITFNLDIDRVENDVRLYISTVARDTALDLGKELKTKVQNNIITRAKESTLPGGLADSVYGDLFDEGDAWGVHVASDLEHALWFEEGTGLFGPRGTYITPRTRPYMQFTPRGQTRKVRAIRVKGQPAQHPFRDALDSMHF